MSKTADGWAVLQGRCLTLAAGLTKTRGEREREGPAEDNMALGCCGDDHHPAPESCGFNKPRPSPWRRGCFTGLKRHT